MFRIVVLCIALVCAAVPASAAGPDDEIPASAYGGLFALKQMSPSLFREKLLPLINAAMKDGKMSYAELARIDEAAGSVGAVFLKSAKSKSMEENIGALLKQAESKGIDITDTLNKAMRSGEMSKLFDGAVDLFRTPKEDKAPQSPSSEQVTEL